MNDNVTPLPSDHHGRFVQIQIPVTFATLTAWDGASWEGAQPENGFREGGWYADTFRVR